jgi:hypothetical protein
MADQPVAGEVGVLPYVFVERGVRTLAQATLLARGRRGVDPYYANGGG